MTALSRKPVVTWADLMAANYAASLPEYGEEATALIASADLLRKKARFNTGTISVASAVLLRCLCDWLKPTAAIEVGTFIGVSTRSIRAGKIYTCDASNDCLLSSPGIETFPLKTSEQMLAILAARKVLADLVFVDGLLSLNDAVLFGRVTHPGTVFAFDDYFLGPAVPGIKPSRKGVVGANLLKGRLRDHVLVEPFIEDSTIAFLVPERFL